MWNSSILDGIADNEVKEGVSLAIEKNLLKALTHKAYPGHFTVTADGGTYGTDNTWPGLDSWQIAGAYLLLGIIDPVLNYFDFVQASQRFDGNIPFAVFPEEDVRLPESRKTHLRGICYPDDIFTYQPPNTDPDKYPMRKWVGLFTHWVYENPLCLLGPICYLLTAAEIYQATGDTLWLSGKMPSLEAAARYILTKKNSLGLIGGAGFYTEVPPRNQWDGITQCYAVKAFRDMRMMYEAAGDMCLAQFWSLQADSAAQAFRAAFWTNGHFAEYIHPEHGAVDWHGLTDVDWAAIGFEAANEGQIAELWPQLTAEPAFWWGSMPTQIVARPYAYREWELPRPVPFPTRGRLFDVAAIGRVWYVETQACKVMGANERLLKAVKLVCRMGIKYGGCWHERYHALQDLSVYPAGPSGYCEYPAILVRTVFGNPQIFME